MSGHHSGTKSRSSQPLQAWTSLSADFADEYAPERNLWIAVVIQALIDWNDLHTTGNIKNISFQCDKRTETIRLKWFLFEPEIEEHNLQWIAANVAKNKDGFLEAVDHALTTGVKLKHEHAVSDNGSYNKIF